MQIPGKVKHFFWRFCHNSLALRTNLNHWGLDIDTRCVMCNRMNEDACHLFFKCKFVKHVLREINMESLRAELEERVSGREVMERIWAQCTRNGTIAIILLWLWWGERNRVREGEQRRTAAELAFMATAQTEEFLKIHQKEKKQKLGAPGKWSKPDMGVMKINSDGAFDPNNRKGGWGFIIRDHLGMVIKAGAGRTHVLLDAFHAEVLACAAGIKAANECGLQRVEAETDSLMLKMAMEDNSYALSALGGIICEMKNFVNTNFRSFSVKYCPRGCNKVAHALAALGCNDHLQNTLSWDDVPSEVAKLVTSDITESISYWKMFSMSKKI